MICTSAESQDAHIATACVDATFDSAFDAARRKIVEVQMVPSRSTALAS
jgi:hypothetical protein